MLGRVLDGRNETRGIRRSIGGGTRGPFRDILLDSRFRVPSPPAQRATAPRRCGEPVTSGRSFPRYAMQPGEARWPGRMAGTGSVRALADGDGEAPQRAARFDSLIHPVVITGHCVIGDQIRFPTAGCAMAGCEDVFADPTALGEADNRARAVAAGWAKDDLGRLVCPACQRDHPVPAWWVYSHDPRPVS